MNHLYTINEIRQIELSTLKALPTGVLMQRAGRAAADLAIQLLPRNEHNGRVLVLAGPGNNGGDALETASILANENIRVSVLLVTGRQKPSAEASMARKHAINSNIEWEDALSMVNAIKSLSSKNWALVVDGMFGIGLREPLSGNRYSLAEFINTLECPVLALDVPSGLNANTGDIVGHENGIAIRATHTITFLGDKPGLHTFQGRDYAGQVHLATLNVEKHHFSISNRWLNDISLFSSCLKKRLHNSHKGTYGSVAILGGAEGMIGAPVLSARTAIHCGAGLCYVVYPKDPPAYDAIQAELMFRAAHRFDFSSSISAVGPGLGQAVTAKEILMQVLNASGPLILDADALNMIAADNSMEQLLYDRPAPVLMTPHPLEAARLLGTSSQVVQVDRLQAARELSIRFNATIILKGSGTIIAASDGKLVINPTGNPALATAGSGDVLTGICAALFAQGWPMWEAALGATWMHGTAADELVKQGVGPVGLTSSELIPAIRILLNRLTAEAN